MPLCSWCDMDMCSVRTTVSQSSSPRRKVAIMHRTKCDQTIITAAGEMTYTARNLVGSCLHHRSPCQANRQTRMGNTDARTLHTECDYDLYLFGACSPRYKRDRARRQTVPRRLSRMKDERPIPGENWSRAVSASQVPMPSNKASSDG